MRCATSRAGSTFKRSEGCSVTGGHVYRGNALPSLWGAYLFADYCDGWIRTLRRGGADGAELTTLFSNTGLHIAAFGEDEGGEIYVLELDGRVYRLRGGV